MGEWFSIELQNGWSSAGAWMDAYGDDLVRTAFGEGATDWTWIRASWGVVLELEFSDDLAYERFARLPIVLAALDNAPDPVNGVLLHRGRGGSTGSLWPRRPRPIKGSGAAALPLPETLGPEDQQLRQELGRFIDAGAGSGQRAFG